MSDKMYYEIDPKTFAISIFDGINDEPFQYQPNYPNGDAFDSVDEAKAWAEEAVKAHDPEYNYFPPLGKGLLGESKPTPEEVAKAKLASIGLTVEELALLLGDK